MKRLIIATAIGAFIGVLIGEGAVWMICGML